MPVVNWSARALSYMVRKSFNTVFRSGEISESVYLNRNSFPNPLSNEMTELHEAKCQPLVHVRPQALPPQTQTHRVALAPDLLKEGTPHWKGTQDGFWIPIQIPAEYGSLMPILPENAKKKKIYRGTLTNKF